jgi:hypothetical protein
MAGEFASCYGVNLAFSGLWVWFFFCKRRSRALQNSGLIRASLTLPDGVGSPDRWPDRHRKACWQLARPLEARLTGKGQPERANRGGTFGVNPESIRIDVRAAGEFASCSRVNLAFSGSGVWFFSASSEGVLISSNLELPQVRLKSSPERKAGFPAGGEALQL